MSNKVQNYVFSKKFLYKSLVKSNNQYLKKNNKYIYFSIQL